MVKVTREENRFTNKMQILMDLHQLQIQNNFKKEDKINL